MKKRYVILVSVILVFSLLMTACASKTKESSKETAVSENTASSETAAGEAATHETSASADTKSSEEGTKESGAATDTASSGGDQEPIKILYSAGLCSVPLHIAKQLQFYEAEGLVEGVDYEYVTTSTATGVEMLTTGQADVSFGLVAAMLAPLDNGLEAKTVLGIHTGCIQIVAGKDKGISSVADLKGKKIGVSQLASSPHIIAQRALAAEGIGTTADNMEVEFVVYDKDNLPLALQNGEVDAVAIDDPKATILINEGYGVSIFNSATSDLLKDEYCCSLWARNDVIEKNSDRLAKIVTAIQKASAWVDQNRELAAEIQLDNEWLVGDLEIDTMTLEHFKYLPSVSGVQEALTRNITDMKKLGLIREDTDADELAKNSFYKLDGVADTVTGTVEAPIDPATQIKKDN